MVYIMAYLKLNIGALKLSCLLVIPTTWTAYLLKLETPKEILGMTIMLWFLYAITIFLDWRSGLRASRFESKRDGIEWGFDRDKANVNWYKHALFMIIIATIYHFRLESRRLEMSIYVANFLMGAQFLYFAYSMIVEWASIEDNKFRITGKKSRFYELLLMILKKLDAGAKKKMEDLTGTKDE